MLGGGFCIEAEGAMEGHAKKPSLLSAPKKGFVCAAIVSGLRLRMQTSDLVEKNLAETKHQISALLTWTLPRARLSQKSQKRFRERMKAFLSPTDPAERVMAYSFTGQDSIEDFLSELSRAPLLYRDVIQDSADPLRSNSRARTAGLVIGVSVGASVFLGATVHEWQEFASSSLDHLNLAELLLAGVGIGLGASEFGGAILSFVMDRDRSFLKFRKQISDAFLSNPPSVPLELLSYDYLILPQTFQEALDRGMISTATLTQETEERPYGSRISFRRFLGLNRVGSYSQKPLMRVSVDFVFEALDFSGGMQNPAQLHVIVRAGEQENGQSENKRKRKKEPVVVPVMNGKLAPVVLRRSITDDN